MQRIKYRFWDKTEKIMRDKLRSHGDLNIGLNKDNIIYMLRTGLKDVDGVDIYEGDIVDDALLGICQVKYSEEFAAFKVLHRNNRTAKWFIDYIPKEFKYLKVIGNIYSHPKVMEEL